jgi:hypothetical protein
VEKIVSTYEHDFQIDKSTTYQIQSMGPGDYQDALESKVLHFIQIAERLK